jgi:hypothetical protein
MMIIGGKPQKKMEKSEKEIPVQGKKRKTKHRQRHHHL